MLYSISSFLPNFDPLSRETRFDTSEGRADFPFRKEMERVQDKPPSRAESKKGFFFSSDTELSQV